jgi:hypothetical protein
MEIFELGTEFNSSLEEPAETRAENLKVKRNHTGAEILLSRMKKNL